MIKNMNKEKLKYGQAIITRNGLIGIYMPSEKGDVFDFGNTGAILVKQYEDDLKLGYDECLDHYTLDVMEVYGLSKSKCGTLDTTTRNRELIWSRYKEETKLSNYEQLTLIRAYEKGYRYIFKSIHGPIFIARKTNFLKGRMIPVDGSGTPLLVSEGDFEKILTDTSIRKIKDILEEHGVKNEKM